MSRSPRIVNSHAAADEASAGEKTESRDNPAPLCRGELPAQANRRADGTGAFDRRITPM